MVVIDQNRRCPDDGRVMAHGYVLVDGWPVALVYLCECGNTIERPEGDDLEPEERWAS
jgi:hypothetical protein